MSTVASSPSRRWATVRKHVLTPTPDEVAEEWAIERAHALEQSRRDGMSLRQVCLEFQTDRDVVLAAVTSNGYALKYVKQEFQADKEIVLAAVKSNGYALNFCLPEFQNDRQVVLAAVKFNQYALKFVGEELRGDREIVREAVKSNGYALKFASKELKDDSDIVIEALKSDPSALQFASPRLQAEIEADDVASQLSVKNDASSRSLVLQKDILGTKKPLKLNICAKSLRKLDLDGTAVKDSLSLEEYDFECSNPEGGVDLVQDFDSVPWEETIDFSKEVWDHDPIEILHPGSPPISAERDSSGKFSFATTDVEAAKGRQLSLVARPPGDSLCSLELRAHCVTHDGTAGTSIQSLSVVRDDCVLGVEVSSSGIDGFLELDIELDGCGDNIRATNGVDGSLDVGDEARLAFTNRYWEFQANGTAAEAVMPGGFPRFVESGGGSKCLVTLRFRQHFDGKRILYDPISLRFLSNLCGRFEVMRTNHPDRVEYVEFGRGTKISHSEPIVRAIATALSAPAAHTDDCSYDIRTVTTDGIPTNRIMTPYLKFQGWQADEIPFRVKDLFAKKPSWVDNETLAVVVDEPNDENIPPDGNLEAGTIKGGKATKILHVGAPVTRKKRTKSKKPSDQAYRGTPIALKASNHLWDTYEWDFGDGTRHCIQGHPEVTHTFDRVQKTPVKLKVGFGDALHRTPCEKYIQHVVTVHAARRDKAKLVCGAMLLPLTLLSILAVATILPRAMVDSQQHNNNNNDNRGLLSVDAFVASNLNVVHRVDIPRIICPTKPGDPVIRSEFCLEPANEIRIDSVVEQ